MSQRFTCEECNIFFGRFRDFAIHQFDHHYEPNPEVIKAVERIIARK